MTTSYRSQQTLKKINRFLKSPDCPPVPKGIERIAFGRKCLDNFINEQLEHETKLAYNDFYGPATEQISRDYDLGNWQNG